MIISGNFVALQVKKDFVSSVEELEPKVIWVNLGNLSRLECYDEAYYLHVIGDDRDFRLTSEAASEIINHMRKEHDDEFRESFEALKNDPGFKKAIKFYFEHRKEAKNDNKGTEVKEQENE